MKACKEKAWIADTEKLVRRKVATTIAHPVAMPPA